MEPLAVPWESAIMSESNKIANHPDVTRALADEMERSRKVGRVFLANDEKVVDVLAAQSHDPIFKCCSWIFWSTLCSTCCATICFLTTLCIKPHCVCKWNLHREEFTTVLVLTNRRIIRYKESNGSASLKNPQRYSHQQIHLSAIGCSAFNFISSRDKIVTMYAGTSHYAQALPDSLLGRCFMLCGCCTPCCHMTRVAYLKFETKYPKPGMGTDFAKIYENSKVDCFLGPLGFLNIYGIFVIFFTFLWKCIVFTFKALFIQPGTAFLEAVGLIKPSSEIIIFEEKLSSFRDRIENRGVDSLPEDMKRYDAFYKKFNLFRSQYQDGPKIPPLNPDTFTVQHDQTWEDAYINTPVIDGDRMFVNSHATGLVTGSEDVINALDVTQQATWIDWLKCCCTCGCFWCGFMKPMQAFKQFFVFTTHRAIKINVFSGNNLSGVYGVMNAYTRTVTSFYDCTPSKGARYEVRESLCCATGRGCSCCTTCCACFNKITGAAITLSTDFGTFDLDCQVKKPVYAKVQAIFSFMVKVYEAKNAFTAEKVGPHVAQFGGISNRAEIFGAECNQSSIGNINLSDMMSPLLRDQEAVHAGVYQYGDWHMSGDAGGADGCWKKYICPDKYWWHSGMVVTEHKILSYYQKCSSADRNSNIVITMTPADKIKASSFFHTAQSYSYKYLECCIKIKNLDGPPLKKGMARGLADLESYEYFGIMRSEIHLGTGSGTGVNFGQAPANSMGGAKASKEASQPHPVTFWGTELTEQSAYKQNGSPLPDLTPKEIELRRLYAVLSAVCYLANQKAIKKEVTDIPAMAPSYNSTPQPASDK